MQTYEASTTVQSEGEIRVAGLPFAPGTEVEVMISLKRAAADEFVTAWKRVCEQMRSKPNLKDLGEDDIQKEIDEYRAGR